MGAVSHAQPDARRGPAIPRPAARPPAPAPRRACPCRAARGRGRRARASRRAAPTPAPSARAGGARCPAGRRRSRRRARQHPLDRREDVLVDHLGRAVGGDPDPALQGRRRRAPRRPRGRSPGGPRPPPRSGPPRRPRAARPRRAAASSRTREVGTQPAGRELVHARDLLDPEAARRALVGERRVEEAVGDDDLARPPAPAGSPRRPAPRARRRTAAPRRGRPIASELSFRSVAYALADGGAARLAHRQRALAERLAEEARLGGLARAVDSLERHEEAGHEPNVAPCAARAPLGSAHEDPGHRRCRLHRLQPRRRPGRARRRGHDRRRPLHRQAREPRGAPRRPSSSRPTSATPARCATSSTA